MDSTEIGARARAVEWPTVALIAATYAVWFVAGTWLYGVAPLAALVVLGFAVAIHSSLIHECLHGHPTRNAALNELLMALPLGLVWPYRRYKAMHLRHHFDERLTDPFDDPESYYRAAFQHATLPAWFQAVLRINNTLLGRMILNPLLGSVGLVLADGRAALAGDRAVIDAWLRHLAGGALVVLVVVTVFPVPFWLYLLVPAWLGQSIIALRTFAEHQWSETPGGRTIIVERSPFAFVFLYNNLHVVHHALPTVAWYRLPALYRERRAEWIARNGGYVFPNYTALARQWLFAAKEPVVHPAWRRDADDIGRRPAEDGRAAGKRLRMMS